MENTFLLRGQTGVSRQKAMTILELPSSSNHNPTPIVQSLKTVFFYILSTFLVT